MTTSVLKNTDHTGAAVYKPSITVFFPVYNDENTVNSVVEKSLGILAELALDYEVLIVNDHSPDAAGAKAEALAAKYPGRVRVIHHEYNMGYGAALKTGFTNAKYEWICQIDGDDQYDIRELPHMLPLMDKYDIIITFRHRYTYSLFRILLSRMYNISIRFIFGVPFRDVGTGFRMIRKSLLEKVSIKYNSSFVGAELAIRSLRANYKVGEAGIESHPRQFGSGSAISFINILKTSIDICRLYMDLNSKSKDPR